MPLVRLGNGSQVLARLQKFGRRNLERHDAFKTDKKANNACDQSEAHSRGTSALIRAQLVHIGFNRCI